MDIIADRYGPHYRHEVVRHISECVARGKSLGLVGIAGAGKSNLIHFLTQPETRRHVLPAGEADRTCFVAVSCLPGDQAADRLYEAMLMAAPQEGTAPPVYPVGAPAFHPLRATLKTACRRQRVVYLFDEFESLLEHQPAEFFDNLRLLRDDQRTSGHLCYLFITHRMPHRVSAKADFEHSKLFELFRNDLYPLPPHTEADAVAMVNTLTQRVGSEPLGNGVANQLARYAGYHCGLIHALHQELYPTLNVGWRTIHRLAQTNARVRKSCEHIWRHLHPEEQEGIHSCAFGGPVERTLADFMRRRGLLLPDNSPTIFSPLFAEYVRSR